MRGWSSSLCILYSRQACLWRERTMVLLISNQSVEDPGAVLRPTLGLTEKGGRRNKVGECYGIYAGRRTCDSSPFSLLSSSCWAGGFSQRRSVALSSQRPAWHKKRVSSHESHKRSRSRVSLGSRLRLYLVNFTEAPSSQKVQEQVSLIQRRVIFKSAGRQNSNVRDGGKDLFGGLGVGWWGTWYEHSGPASTSCPNANAAAVGRMDSDSLRAVFIIYSLQLPNVKVAHSLQTLQLRLDLSFFL